MTSLDVGTATAAIRSVEGCRDGGSILVGPVTLDQAVSLVDRIPLLLGEHAIAPEGQVDVDLLVAEFENLRASQPTP